MPFAPSPNISRFPYASHVYRPAPSNPAPIASEAELAPLRAAYLDSLDRARADANAAVKQGAAAIIAQMRARRAHGGIITSATMVTIDMGDAPTLTAPLGECFPDDDAGLADAIADLAASGMHVGGGAAPGYVLRLVAGE